MSYKKIHPPHSVRRRGRQLLRYISFFEPGCKHVDSCGKNGLFWLWAYGTSGASAASLKRNLEELQFFVLPHRLHFSRPEVAPWFYLSCCPTLLLGNHHRLIKQEELQGVVDTYQVSNMSVNVVKDAETTVITVTVDKKSMLPPLCQILKALCYSPGCFRCTIYEGMMQTSVTAALGVIQIMVGLFNIGLGSGRISIHPEDFAHLGVSYWLGGVFLLCGIVSVLAGRFSSFCLVGFAVFMNIVGFIFSIVGIVMYSNDLKEDLSARFCNWSEWNDCHIVLSTYRRLLTGIDITMIVATVLQLCVCISLAVLSIKALINMKKKKDLIKGQWYKWAGQGPPKGVTWPVSGPDDPLGICFYKTTGLK